MKTTKQIESTTLNGVDLINSGAEVVRRLFGASRDVEAFHVHAIAVHNAKLGKVKLTEYIKTSFPDFDGKQIQALRLNYEFCHWLDSNGTRAKNFSLYLLDELDVKTIHALSVEELADIKTAFNALELKKRKKILADKAKAEAKALEEAQAKALEEAIKEAQAKALEEAQAKALEETPETETPETETPETEAPETETPETEAPETETPETEAPETEVVQRTTTTAPRVNGEGKYDILKFQTNKDTQVKIDTFIRCNTQFNNWSSGEQAELVKQLLPTLFEGFYLDDNNMIRFGK